MIFSSLLYLDMGSGKEGYWDTVFRDPAIICVDMPLVMDLYEIIY